MASPDLPIDTPQLHQYGLDGRLDMRSIKIMTDGMFWLYLVYQYWFLIVITLFTGALGSWGAALLEPYSDDPTTSGIMRYKESELAKVVEKWWNAGWGIVSGSTPALTDEHYWLTQSEYSLHRRSCKQSCFGHIWKPSDQIWVVNHLRVGQEKAKDWACSDYETRRSGKDW